MQRMVKTKAVATAATPGEAPYALEGQVGFLLRQANQRHMATFARHFGEVTSPQWAAMAKLHDVGACSQNHLGRLTSMDVATIKGVVDRLARRGYVTSVSDAADRRRVNVRLSAAGQAFYDASLAAAFQVSADTLAALTPAEQEVFLTLVRKLA